MNQRYKTKPEVSFGEKIAFGMGDVGGNFISCLTAAFLTLYYTDTALIDAAFVGTMMLLCRVFDGVSDIIVGLLIDRTHTKMGKARPWLLGSILPMAIMLFLTFNVPANMTIMGKSVYVYATYIGLAVVSYTIGSLSYASLTSLISSDRITRQSLSTIRFLMAFIAMMFINSMTNTLVENFGGGQTGWRTVSIIYAVILAVCHLITFLFCKERVDPDAAPEADSMQVAQPKMPLGESLKVLFSNKYTYIIIVFYVTNFIVTSASNGVGVFFSRDVLGDAALFGVLTITNSIPVIIAMPFTTKLVEKFGKKNCLYAGLLLQILGYGMMFLANSNLPVILVGSAIRGFGMAPYSPVQLSVVSDLGDNIAYKTGKHVEGLAYSVSSFGMKFGMGLGGAMLGWLLALGGYDALAAVQSDSALLAMRTLFALIPVICYVISFVLTFFFNIEKENAEFKAQAK